MDVQIRGSDIAINVAGKKRNFFKSYLYSWSTYFTNCTTSRIVSETSISSLNRVYLRSTKETISTTPSEEIPLSTVFWSDSSADFIFFHGSLKTEKSCESKISLCLLMTNASVQLNRKRLPLSLWSSKWRRHVYDQRSSSRCHGHKFSDHSWTAKRFTVGDLLIIFMHKRFQIVHELENSVDSSFEVPWPHHALDKDFHQYWSRIAHSDIPWK